MLQFLEGKIINSRNTKSSYKNIITYIMHKNCQNVIKGHIHFNKNSDDDTFFKTIYSICEQNNHRACYRSMHVNDYIIQCKDCYNLFLSDSEIKKNSKYTITR